MISATPSGSHAHSHSLPSPNHRALNLENGRGCTDSQRFLVPPLPVSSRLLSGDINSKRRERSIVNGTAQQPGDGSYSHFPYLHPTTPRHSFHHHNGHISNNSHDHSHNQAPGFGFHHQHSSLLNTKKDSPYNSSSGLNPDIHQGLQHQLPTNPSNFHHLSRSSMPIPCSSPAVGSSASPKSISPAVNSQAQNRSRSPQLIANSSFAHSTELSLNSPLRFYQGGFPPSHPVAFYAAAAAAAASHHGIPYPVFGSPYPPQSVATANSYLETFHSTLLAQAQQQQGQQLKLLRPSQSPQPKPSNSNFHRSPMSSPLSSLRSSQARLIEPGSTSETGRYRSSHTQPIDNSPPTRYGLESAHRFSHFPNNNKEGIFSNLVYSGLSKGGPLGIDISEGPKSSSHCNRSRLDISQVSEERNERSISISSKFHNLDPVSVVRAERKDLPPVEQDLRIERKSHLHDFETFESMNNKQALNGKEGSLKHRILTRSPEQTINSPIRTKMSKPVFTFPTPEQMANHNNEYRGHASMFSSLQMRELQQNIAGNNNTLCNNTSCIDSSYLFTNPKKLTAGDLNYASLNHPDILPSVPRPSLMAANTTTTDSATYLSQIQKPSNLSTSRVMPTYVSPIKSALNPSAMASPSYQINSNGRLNNNKGMPSSPTNCSSSNKSPSSSTSTNNTKFSALPVEQMPVIHAFKKGSLIQLASGQLKSVEDLRVEDFHCAAATLADSLRILHCTVVSIQTSSNEDMNDQLFCKITLAVGTQQNQVVMDTTPAQPFFVVGRGWASWSPEITQKVLQLPCSSLKVGDICITLTKMARMRAGINGGLSKSSTTKYKNHATSILSSVSRRGSNIPYASKILKVANGNLLKSNNKTKTKLGLLPKSPGRVTFEQLETPSSITVGTNLKTKMSPFKKLLSPNISVESVPIESCNTLALAEQAKINTQDESPCPKKRRWSAPDIINDRESKSCIGPLPKRPISHSPVHTLP